MAAAKTVCAQCGAPMYPDERPPVVCTLCRQSIGDGAADTIVDLRQQLDAATARVDQLEDHLAAALDVIIAVETKDDAALEDLQVRLDEMEKPYSERRLVVRRRPEYGWAVWDKDTGEKLRPVNPNQWFRDRKTALAAKATEQPPMGVK
jgi:hypothetical protein